MIMDDNEKMLEWLDRLRDGVANRNAEAERVCQTAMRGAIAVDAPHVHVAGTTVGKHIDECAVCGRDLRDRIHARSL